MPGIPADVLRPALRPPMRWALSPRADFPTMRRRVGMMMMVPGAPLGTRIEPTTLGGVPCERMRPRDAHGDLHLLYFHGGGYAIGSARAMRALTGRLAAALRAEATSADYRLAPEHPYPAAIDDARAVWDALTAEVDAGQIVVAGDSAGGGLSLALAVALREEGRPLPAALGLICPWVDLTDATAAGRRTSPRDPVLSAGFLEKCRRAYVGTADASDPLISPGLADLAGLPPMVIHTGDDDTISDDGCRLADRARAAGVEVRHERLPGLWHDPHLTAAVSGGQAGRCIADLGAALRTTATARPAVARGT